jgi:hypothetical protein
MIRAEKNCIRRRSTVWPVAVKGEDEWMSRRGRQAGVRVQYVNRLRQMATDVEVRPTNGFQIQPYDMSFTQPGSRRRENGDLMSQLDQAPRQPDHNPLGATVAVNRQQRVGIQSYAHVAAMYRAAAGLLKQWLG